MQCPAALLMLLGVVGLLSPVVWGCDELQLQSSKSRGATFRALPESRTRAAGLTSGRLAYASTSLSNGENANAQTLYLYHVISGERGDDKRDGLGRWVVNDVLGHSDTALSYLNSWAVSPTLHSTLNDNARNMYWMVHDGKGWVPDEEMSFSCSSGVDSAIYFAVDGAPWRMAGFLIKHSTDNEAENPVYSHIGTDDEKQLYLYRKDDKWIIGNTVGSVSGFAYTVAPKARNAADLVGNEWLFVAGGDPTWRPFEVTIILGDEESDVYTNLRNHRHIVQSSDSEGFYSLRNGVPIPRVGLGTGGITWQRTTEVLTDALQLGYRLLDSAREYGNEKVIGDILSPSSKLAEVPARHEVFLISKVWPTFLGYVPTSGEITKSQEALKTSYIDQYLLHWPKCNNNIAWMHCESTVDSTGNWKQSWNALERAYAEGRVASIGVSNFDRQLLGEFWGFGSVRPHLVQNFADPSQLDMRVREWCLENRAVYMPYAHQRNFKFLPQKTKEAIEAVASQHNVSSHVVVSRFFYQSGAAIVPRSSQAAHLKENLHDLVKFALTVKEMKAIGWTLPVDMESKVEL